MERSDCARDEVREGSCSRLLHLFPTQVPHTADVIFVSHMTTPRPVIVGTGIAGLWTAWRLASEGQAAVVVTKETLADSASAWAQGGIAVAIGPGDSPSQHAADTLAASDGLADPEAVRILTNEGPEQDLRASGPRRPVRSRTRRPPSARARGGAHQASDHPRRGRPHRRRPDRLPGRGGQVTPADRAAGAHRGRSPAGGRRPHLRRCRPAARWRAAIS